MNFIIRLVLSYILGILFASQIQIPWFLTLIFALFFSLSSVCFICRKFNSTPCLLVLIFLLGMFKYQLAVMPAPAGDISKFEAESYVTLVGTIAEEPNYRPELTLFKLKVDKIKERRSFRNSSGELGVWLVGKEFPELDYGTKLEVRGKLKKITPSNNPGLASSGRLQMIVYQKPKILGENSNWFYKTVLQLKRKLLSIHQKTLPAPEAALLSSIIFGARASRVPDELQAAFRRCGVIHTLVVSGQQTVLLVGLSFAVLNFFKLPLSINVILVTIINLVFMVMTGAGASIVRSSIMAQITLLGLLFERESEVYNSLALAAFIILIFNPAALFEIGFQLSFLATWALVYIAPAIKEYCLPKLPLFFSVPLSVSLAPILATTPIIVYNFGQVSIIALLANIVVIPLIEALVTLGFASTLLGIIFLPAAEIINGANYVLLGILERTVSFFANLPFACTYVAPPLFLGIAMYYIILVVALNILRKEKRIIVNFKRILLFCLILITFCIWNTALGQSPTFGEKQLTVTFLDVGQGDSILIEPPSGNKILIDGGDLRAGKYVIPQFLHRQGINKLDLVVLTHPHDDHVGGLPEVFKNIEVASVLDSGRTHTCPAYQNFLDLIWRNKMKYEIASCGQILQLGNDVTAEVLSPQPPFLETLNNNSVVIRLVYKNVSFLLMGDAEREEEARILNSGAILPSNILKMGHHGSSTASSVEFLDAVSPQIAVISVGTNNKFFHPHPSTLQKLAERGSKIFRTDLNGAVIIKTNGERYIIETTN